MSSENSYKTPKIAVIIPCFNQGIFIEEAIDSVLTQTFTDFEIIVVNDGSTDERTNDILNRLDKPKTKVIVTGNQGLPEARNTAIKNTEAEYILPLDADDKIANTFLEKAVKVLDTKKNAGIVASYFEAFGAESWISKPEFDYELELTDNQIVATSMFRRKDCEKVGGYKKNMKYGWEDYDLWLSFLELGRTVEIIPEVMFYYRKHIRTTGSAPYSLSSIDHEKELYLRKQLMKNHPTLYKENPDVFLKRIVKQKYTIIDLDAKLKAAEEQLQKRTITNMPFLLLSRIKKLIKK